MSLRPKTKRLVLVIGTLTIVVGGVLFWMVLGPAARAARRAAEHRTAADAALARGDYAAALPHFSQYITLRKPDWEKPEQTDLDALLGLADCRRRLPRLGGLHLIEAADHVDRVLKRRDRDPHARRLMMELVQRMDRRPELAKARQSYSPAANYAALVLEDQPGDVEASLIIATSALRGDRPSAVAAGPHIKAAVAAAPGDHRTRQLLLLADAVAGAPPEQTAAAAERLAADNSADAAALLAASEMFADLATGVRPAAGSTAATRPASPRADRERWLARSSKLAADAAAAALSAKPAPSRQLAEDLALACERHGHFSAAVDVLIAAQQARPDPETEWTIVRKLWQLARHDEVLSRTAALNPANADGELAGYRGLALLAQAESAAAGSPRSTLLNQVDAISSALAARKSDTDASVWTTVLQAESSRISADPKTGAAWADQLRRLLAARAVAAKRYDHPFLVARCGDAMAAIGDTDAALMFWDVAQARRSDWGYPAWRIGKALYEQGSAVEAEPFALDAASRMPNDPRPAGLLIAARWRAKTFPTARLLESTDTALKRWPNDPALVPMAVVLTAIVKDPAAAAERIDAALAAKPTLSPDALEQLLEADRARRLDREQPLIAALTATPEGRARNLARQADLLIEQNKPAEGLALLERARTAGGWLDEAIWAVRIAAYRERSGDPTAAKVWTKLSDDHAADPRVQAQVLISPVCRKDPTLIKSAVDRIRAAEGDEGLLWRTASAEAALVSSETPSAERTKALATLSDVASRVRVSAEPHVRLGRALLRERQFGKAVEALNQAQKLRLYDADIALLSADAARQSGRVEAGRELLDRVANHPVLTPQQRLAAADLLEQFDDRPAAIRLLTAGPAGPARDARLAQLHAASGQSAEAAAAFNRLLNDPAAAAADLLAGAAYFASAGDSAKSGLFLERLRTMDLPPAELAITLARHEEQYGTRARAIEQLTAATAAHPADARVWRALAAANARGGNWSAAAQSLAAGITSAGNDSNLLALQSAIRTAQALPEPSEAIDVLVTLLEEPQSDAGPAMLKLIGDRQTALVAAKSTAERESAWKSYREKIVALAADHPRFWPAQRSAVLSHRAAGRQDEAAKLADAVAARFPASTEAARIASESHAALGQWDEALNWAKQWRSRSRGETLPADIAIARIGLARRNRSAAEAALSSYTRSHPIPTADAAPATQPTTTRPVGLTSLDARLVEAHMVYAQALIELGRTRDAGERLQPLLTYGKEGAVLWLSLAGSFDKAATARAWIERGLAGIPPEDRATSLAPAMAAAWLEAGRSTGDTTMLQSAFDLSVGPPSESASGLTIIRAHAAHLLGKYDDALAAWRQIVARSDDPGYLNNLAYILLVRGNPADLDEAYKLARTAADAAGSDAGILGTLALAESRKGNRAAAIATYRKAIAIDATNIEAMIGLAEELARGNSNERAEARTLAQRANAKLIGPARQLPELRRQLDAVMAAIDTGSPK